MVNFTYSKTGLVDQASIIYLSIETFTLPQSRMRVDLGPQSSNAFLLGREEIPSLTYLERFLAIKLVSDKSCFKSKPENNAKMSSTSNASFRLDKLFSVKNKVT